MFKKHEEPRILTVIVLTTIVISVWVLLGYYASTRTNPGTFGDMFGAVNALFSVT